MARFRKSEYRTEKRARPADKPEVFTKCQGDMGNCRKRDLLLPCVKCRKPYCEMHLQEHPRYCLGVN